MISIIVPVYNVELYLDKCLESIQNQSYQNWECILVDDGSKDNSPDICDLWVQKDNRFSVIHQKNQGVSAARNNGIQIAKGKYITFIDSDDWIDNCYLSDLIKLNKADIIISGIRLVKDGQEQEIKPNTNTTYTLKSINVALFVEANSKSLLYGPTNKLYSSEIIHKYNIRFPISCSYGEDLQFNYTYLEHVNTIAHISKANYNYRIIGSNTLSTNRRPNQFQEDYEQWKLLKNFYCNHGLWIEPAIELLYRRLWGIIYDGIFSTNTDIKTILSIPEIKELRKHKRIFSCSWWIKYGILYKLFFLFKR